MTLVELLFYHVRFDGESKRWDIEISFANVPSDNITFQTTPSQEEKILVLSAPDKVTLASSFNVSLERYKIPRARKLVRQSLFDLQTQRLKQLVNIAWTGRTDGNLEVSSELLISQKYFWAQVRNQGYSSIGIETCTYLDESDKKGQELNIFRNHNGLQ